MLCNSLYDSRHIQVLVMTPAPPSTNIHRGIYDFLMQSLWLFYKDGGMMMAGQQNRAAGGHFRLN